MQWLEDIALVTGMSDQKLEHIRRIGDCDGQVDQRIGVLCQVLEIDRSALGV
ncbi:hypothetical protein IH981_01955 [Patescibacteria group bacterium]|nr:hypothetical protein [Patescibacteria group bacterium]